MNNFSIKNWWLAIRPKTLGASIAPVIIGTAMAYGDGFIQSPTRFVEAIQSGTSFWNALKIVNMTDLSTALLCFWGALFIQIGTNLANDYHDFKKGTDNDKRIGPIRVSQAGLISPNLIMWAYMICFIIVAIICHFLVQIGGLPIAIIGITAILSGIFYTAGKKPLGYLGLGDIFVFIFFGPIAVSCTYYLQTLELNYAVILAGISPGLISVGILAVNNYRDVDNDRISGKKTLAVRFGPDFAQLEYMVCIFLATLLPVLIYVLIDDHIAILSCVVLILFAIPAFYTVLKRTDGPSLNKILGYTSELLLCYSILFSIGWII